MKVNEFNQKQIDVIRGVKILATSYEQNRSGQVLSNWYALIDDLFETDAERVAFEEGAIALIYDIGDRRFRAWYHSRKFRKALNKVGA